MVRVNSNTLYMYYVGFELGVKIRYRLFTGLAISEDNGNTFEKYSEIPVLDRSNSELFFRCGPYCSYDGELFRLWYVAGSTWTTNNGKQMPEYDIRYMESKDGIHWPDKGEVIVEISDADEHGFGRPVVIKRNDEFLLFYSIRKKSCSAYRLGLATSIDCINWTRIDETINLDVSENSYDSQAIMYAYPFEIKNKLYVFYNGNNFGKDGVMSAVLDE